MAVDRLVPGSGSPPPVSGPDFMDAVGEEIGALWAHSILPLTNVGGTADAITADVSPALTGSVAAGMGFWLVPVADNTSGSVTLNIGGTGAIDLVTEDGGNLAAGNIKTGRQLLLISDGTNLRVMGTASLAKTTDYQAFTSSGTWNKPANTPDAALVVIEVWGGGGGGGQYTGGASHGSAGGGGGGWVRRVMRAGALASTVAVTVGAGGAIGNGGAASSFGTHATVYGGGAGQDVGGVVARGGGGGSPLGAGDDGSAGGESGGFFGLGGLGANGFGNEQTALDNRVNAQAGADGTGGGGGGGAGNNTGSNIGVGSNGGGSIHAGGGGGGSSVNGYTNGLPGTSLFGGNGGGVGANGAAPGGGGGAGGAGARGEVRVWTIG